MLLMIGRALKCHAYPGFLHSQLIFIHAGKTFQSERSLLRFSINHGRADCAISQDVVLVLLIISTGWNSFVYSDHFISDNRLSACPQTLCAVCTLCHISLMVAFNSVLSNWFFFPSLSRLFLFCPSVFILVDMNGIIKLPQSEWLNRLCSRIYLQ